MSKKSTSDANQAMPVGNGTGELEAPIWAVISFEKCEAAGLNYQQAIDRIAELERAGTYGLCIVTDEAAARIAERPSPPE